MILDRISFKNFGVYGGLQKIDLTPKKGKPVVLLGALNGGGKTTFLDAVQLVLYGSNARCSNRGKLGYKQYLREAIHRGADPAEGSEIQLEFRRTLDGMEHRFILIRHWYEGPKGIEEQITVMRDGEPDSVLAEHWQEYIESYIPSGISHLFFFDAEQIATLADGENAAEILGTAIHSLLGLDLVERLQSDLVTLERRKKKEKRSDQDLKEIALAEEEVQTLDRLVEETHQHAANLKGELEQLDKQYKKKEQQFKAEGGDLFTNRKEMELQLNSEEASLLKIEERLRELSAGAAPLLLVPELMDAVEKEARHDIKVRHAHLVSEELVSRDEALLELIVKEKTGEALRKKIESFLENDRSLRAKLANEPYRLGVDDEFLAHFRHLRTKQLPEIDSQIKELIGEAESWREKVARSEAALARVPDADAIAEIQRDLETMKVRIRNRQAEWETAQAKFESMRNRHEAAMATHNKLLNQNLDVTFQDEDRERILRHAAKVRNTLAKFREHMVQKHAAKIEGLMLESFSQLLRKKSLVKAIHIDPSTFQIQLTGADGTDLPMNRLSAGERQLLATALLWGLARASGRPIPTIIDTPLGRLDSEHRKHLVQRYFPVASHQVILLSTDEEIDEQSLQEISKSVSHSYAMIYDEALQRTRVEEGYFWNYESTC